MTAPLRSLVLSGVLCVGLMPTARTQDLAAITKEGWVAGTDLRQAAPEVEKWLGASQCPPLSLALPSADDCRRIDPRQFDLRFALSNSSGWVAHLLPDEPLEECVMPYRRAADHDGLCILQRTKHGTVQLLLSQAHLLVVFRVTRPPEALLQAPRDEKLKVFIQMLFYDGTTMSGNVTFDWQPPSAAAVLCGVMRSRLARNAFPPGKAPWYVMRPVRVALASDSVVFLAMKLHGNIPVIPTEAPGWFGQPQAGLPPYRVALDHRYYEIVRPRTKKDAPLLDASLSPLARWKQRLLPLADAAGEDQPRAEREAVVAEVLAQFRANEAAAKAAKEPERTKLLAEVREQRTGLFELLVYVAEVQENAAWRQWLLAQAQTLLVLPKLAFPTLTAAQQAQATQVVARLRELKGQPDDQLETEIQAFGVFLDEYYWQALDAGATGEGRQNLYYRMRHPGSIPRLLAALGAEDDSNLRRAIAKSLANTVKKRSDVDDDGKVSVQVK